MKKLINHSSNECTIAPVFEEKTAFVLTEKYLSYLMKKFFTSQTLYDQALGSKEILSIPNEVPTITSLYHVISLIYDYDSLESRLSKRILFY